MKRGFGRGLSGRALLAVLCLSFLLSVESRGAETLRMVSVTNDRWRSDLVIVAQARDTAVTVSDLLIAPRKFANIGDCERVDNFRAWYVQKYDDVAILPVTTERGYARMWTEAIYRDAFGNFNTVTIPPLRPAMKPGERHTIDAIASDTKRSTFIALFTDGAGFTQVRLRILDGRGEEVGIETVEVSGFTFYEIRTRVGIGRLELTNTPPQVGCVGCRQANVYAVAFIGRREGGSPRTELPYPAL